MWRLSASSHSGCALLFQMLFLMGESWACGFTMPCPAHVVNACNRHVMRGL
jgi:hypothetical protein